MNISISNDSTYQVVNYSRLNREQHCTYLSYC